MNPLPPFDTLSDKEYAQLTPRERYLLLTLTRINNIARNWRSFDPPCNHTERRALNEIIDISATVFESTGV